MTLTLVSLGQGVASATGEPTTVTAHTSPVRPHQILPTRQRWPSSDQPTPLRSVGQGGGGLSPPGDIWQSLQASWLSHWGNAWHLVVETRDAGNTPQYMGRRPPSRKPLGPNVPWLHWTTASTCDRPGCPVHFTPHVQHKAWPVPVTQALLADGRKTGTLSPGAVAFPGASGLLLSQEPHPLRSSGPSRRSQREREPRAWSSPAPRPTVSDPMATERLGPTAGHS